MAKKHRVSYLQLEFDFDTGGVILPPKKPPVFKTDNEKILSCEKEYLKDRKRNAKNLFNAIRKCAKRFVAYEVFKRGLPYIDYNEKAIDASSYIMLQYATRPDFRLLVPSAYIRLRVLAALFRHKKIDEITTYTGDEL